jgi:hypothetical protein
MKERIRKDQEKTKKRPRKDQEKTKKRPRKDQEKTKKRPDEFKIASYITSYEKLLYIFRNVCLIMHCYSVTVVTVTVLLQ